MPQSLQFIPLLSLGIGPHEQQLRRTFSGSGNTRHLTSRGLTLRPNGKSQASVEQPEVSLRRCVTVLLKLHFASTDQRATLDSLSVTTT